MSVCTAESKADNSTIAFSDLTADSEWWMRFQELQKFYYTQFGVEPTLFVRVPGRVNIIGEHVDYCGYPVLPMAINQSILLALSYTEEHTILHLSNMDSKKFHVFQGDLKYLRMELSNSNDPRWYKYYLCGILGIYEALGLETVRFGMKVAVSGNVPIAAGLSSSSALVSAATLATAYVHSFPLNRKLLASISASCERYIGTQGGGMDQAIAFLGKHGCAQFIEFLPELRATSIPLPSGFCFTVANSLSEKNKAASSDFNERVVECRIGCCILARKVQSRNWHTLTRFVQLESELGCTLLELEALIAKWLPKESYTRSEILEGLRISEDDFNILFLTENTRQMNTFKLRQRALHVIQESMRVLKFRAICEQATNNGVDRKQSSENNCITTNDKTQESAVILLSELMRESHYSLRQFFECSHPKLENLIQISAECNVGAKLTGAGWGGCIVALCESLQTSQQLIQILKEKYYALLPTDIRQKYQHNEFDDVVFTTVPSDGAEIYRVPLREIE